MSYLTRAERLASDIDAELHGGQRSPERYRRILPLIEKVLDDMDEAAWWETRNAMELND